MKPSSNFNLSRLVSALHPPLPRTERQSQQLLEVLTSSFRSQLDAAHPPVEQRHDGGTRRSRSNSTTSHERSKSPSASHASNRVTETHLKDILNHPLFSGPTSSSASATSTTSGRGSYSVRGVASDTKQIREDPLAVFVSDIAHGQVTRARLETCLEALKANLMKEAKAKVALDSSLNLAEVYRKEMANSEGVGHILSYFGSLDTKTMVYYLSWSPTVNAFMPFLVAAQKEMFVGDLLKSLYAMVDSEEVPRPHIVKAQHTLIGNLLNSEITHGRGLETAILHYARICRFYDRVHNPNGDKRSTALQSCGRWLLKKIIAQSHAGAVVPKNEVSVDGFAMFSQCRPHWRRKDCDNDFWDAILPLYHPATPNPVPYLAFLQNKSLNGKEDWIPEKDRKIVLRVTLDAARILLDGSEVRAAGVVMEYVKRNFATDLELEELERISVSEGKNKEVMTEEVSSSYYRDLVHELEVKFA